MSESSSKFRDFLESQNISLDELSSRTGITVTSLQRYIKGYKIGHFKRAIQIARALNVAPELIFGDSERTIRINPDLPLYKKMQERGISLRELAELSGVSLSLLYVYLTGRSKNLHANNSLRVAKSLNCQPEELFTMPNCKHPTELRKIMFKKGISVSELAQLTGIKTDTVYHYYINRTKPSISNAIKIARSLNLPIEEIFPVPEQISVTDNLTAI